MRLTPTNLPGVVMVDITPHEDERGLFARVYDEAVFKAAGLPHHWPQSSLSFNRKRGTLRGMHYQKEPKGEPKLVRCARGRIFDVAVDLRPQSPTYRRWIGLELSADNRRALYIPPGCAHGFITLEDECEVAYQIGEDYVAELARGVRWNDPAFAIAWPIEPTMMAERDAGYADFAP
jgi:dTDP-4-dehydrorhamnose 3,5-epimerase